MKMKFNECPHCGAAPDALTIQIHYLPYPKGVFKEGHRDITAFFSCHQKRNVACAVGTTENDLHLIEKWETLPYSSKEPLPAI